MKIQYLGTAAAEAVPAIFCTCPHCRYARKVGGKEIRTRSGAIIDGTLKLDFPPDSVMHMVRYGLDYTMMKHILITHSHSDHFNFNDLAYRRKGYASLPKGWPSLHIYGNDAVTTTIRELGIPGLEPHLMVPFVPMDVGGYKITPMKAVHMVGTKEQPLFYLIEKDGKSLLYAHDTDEFPEDDMDFLAGRHIDLISMDCTNAAVEHDYVGHMCIYDNLRMRERLLSNGAADGHTIFVCNHFSHNGLVSYEEMEKLADGMLVSYDGMEVEF